MHRVYISICSEGFGHSSRCLAVAEELSKRKDTKVMLAAYNYVLDYLKSLKKFRVAEIGREVAIEGENGSFDFTKSVLKTLRLVLTKYGKIVKDEREKMERFRATVVLSDSRFSPIIAGSYQLGLPLVYMTNQTAFRKKLKGVKGKFVELFYKKPLNFFTSVASIFAEYVVIPDFEPPLTICQELLSRDRRVKKKMIFSGPVVKREMMYGKERAKLPKRSILFLVGGMEYRLPLIEAAIKLAKQRKDLNLIVVSKLIKETKRKDNLLLVPFLPKVAPFMRSAEVVVTQAGHSTIMEMITLAKKMLLVPDQNHYEQESNAGKVKKLKLGEVLRYDNLNVKSLGNKIDMLLSSDVYQRNLEKLSKKAREMDGAKRVADLLVSLSERILQKY